MKSYMDREHIAKTKICWLLAEDVKFIKESIATNEYSLVTSYLDGYIGGKEKKQYAEMNDDEINREFDSRILSIINQASYYSEVKAEFDKIFPTLNREISSPNQELQDSHSVITNKGE